MTRRLAVTLSAPASEMACEEIVKQVAYLSNEIRNVGFAPGGATLECDVPIGDEERLERDIKALADRMQRSLRKLERKIVYRTTRADRPTFASRAGQSGVHVLGRGQVALEGQALALFQYFDRTLARIGERWDARPVLTPTLIPAAVLARCDYFRSFPQSVTFACHLHEELSRIDDFRTRHSTRDDLDERATADMATPEACLSPAVCYHIYHLFKDRVIGEAGTAHAVCGKCFRYEAGNTSDLRRLWDFTMREVVLMGTRDQVLARRQEGIEAVARFLEEHELAGEIRTASDPFFIAPDAPAKTYFQLSSETKYEISLMLPDEERVAVGSLNYHTDFFGRAFDVALHGGGPMHSVCIAFGLERFVHAFLAQHGDDPARWPAAARIALDEQPAEALCR